MKTTSPNISFILNAHREGLLLVPALRSAIAARAECDTAGLTAEIIVVGDRVDSGTTEAINNALSEIDTIDYVDFGNLGLARQHAIHISRGEFLAFLDGDDVWQASWPTRAYDYANKTDYRNHIYHTEVFAGFGMTTFLRHQIQTSDTLYHPLHLACNWHYCNNLFAHRSIFERFPIQPYDHKQGYGSEDWHWSCETLSAGLSRAYVPRTVYFYRLDPIKPSLGAARGLVLRPTKLLQSPFNGLSYADYSGITDEASEHDLTPITALGRSSSPPVWLIAETISAAAIEHDIHSLLSAIDTLQLSTARLYPVGTYVYQRLAAFCSDSTYTLVGFDCESADPEWLPILNHTLHTSEPNRRIVILCGDILTNRCLIKIRRNRLFINYKLLMRLESQDPYSLNNCIANFLSNHHPECVININSEFVDYFTGIYHKFLRSQHIVTRRLLFGPVHDIGASFKDRRILANINQQIFRYNELWVRHESSAEYLRRIYRCKQINIQCVPQATQDAALRCALNEAPAAMHSTHRTSLPRPQHSLPPPHQPPIAVSCILNLHQEGELVVPTLESVSRMLSHTSTHHLKTELIIVMDNSDTETTEIVDYAVRGGVIPHTATTLHVNHNDLARSRRSGIDIARGQCVALLDGDDLYTPNWITSAYQYYRSRNCAPTVYHPEVNIYFGSGHRVWWHPDMLNTCIPVPGLLLDNYWSSLSFAERSLFVNFPLADIDLAAGFGFEDWHWNMETVARNILHRNIPGTAHFIRLKPTGSLNHTSAAKGARVRPSSFPAELLWNRLRPTQTDPILFQPEDER